MKDCQLKDKFCANKIYRITYPDPWEFRWILQNTLHYIENNFLLCCLKEWVLVSYPLTERTLFGSFPPQGKVLKQRLTFDEMMGAKLCSAVYPQMM